MNFNPLAVLQTIASKVVTRSVLNPLLWTFAISICGVFLLAWVAPASILEYLFIAPAAVLAAILVGFGYFSLKQPGLLLSEDHQYQRLQLELGDSVHGAGRRRGPVVLTENPQAPRLPVQDETS